MRVSVKRGDPGYRIDAHRFRPFLNGEYIKDCFTADEELGTVAIYNTDSEGNYILIMECESCLKKTRYAIGEFTHSCPHCGHWNDRKNADLETKILHGEVILKPPEKD